MTDEQRLLTEFIVLYPFQPATAFWRAVEIAHVLAQPLPAGAWLDLGCGDGKLTRIIRDRMGAGSPDRLLVGLDSAPGELSLARQLGLYDELHLAGSDAIPEPEGRFDFVFSNSVLEHVAPISETLAEAARVLKPGGTFLFTVPGPNFRRFLRGPILPSTTREKYYLDLDRRLAHLRYWTVKEWDEALENAGLVTEKVSGYLTRRQVRRWETISRFTAGILVALFRQERRPIEIQHKLGLRSSGTLLKRMPRPIAAALARALAIGALPSPAGALTLDEAGCLAIRARKSSG